MGSDIETRTSDDEDMSLFGSAPPSPAPLQLSLPGLNQNVGTIALPGSHPHSELPVLPPASSLSTPQLFLEPTPRANSSAPKVPNPRPLFRPSPSPTREAEKPARQAKRRRLDTPSGVQHPPVKISFPAADEPIPPNFLRNQEGLLGHAGIVAGLQPSRMPSLHTRGESRRNPIVIDCDRPQPRIGRRPPRDEAPRAPVLTQEQVLASLVKNKEAVSVLASILDLVSRRQTERANQASGSAGEGTSSQHPEEHHTENTKKLVGRLITLIQDAARNAANEESRRRNPGHYRPATAKYGQPSHSQTILVPSSTTSSETPILETMMDASVTSFHQPVPLFDDLVASLDLFGMMSPTQSSIELNSDMFNLSYDDTSSPNQPNGASMPTGELNLDELIAMIESLPSAPMEGNDASNVGLEELLALPEMDDSSATTTGIHSNNFIIDPALLEMNLPNATSSTSGGYPSSSSTTLPTLSSTNSAVPSLTSAMTSPLASTSSLADPSTPQWDIFPDPEIAPGVQGWQQDQLMVGFPPGQPTGGPSTPLSQAFTSCRVQTASPSPTRSVSVDVERQGEASPASTLSNLGAPATPTASASCSPPITVAPPTTSHTVRSAAPRASVVTQAPPASEHRGSGRPRKTRTRQDIMQAARERRRQLEAELERAKVELWETTLEQGVLSNIIKNATPRPA